MDAEEMDQQHSGVINFWTSLRNGPWGKQVAARIETALTTLVVRLASLDGMVALIVYGSYARGEAGKSSDLDLLVLFERAEQLKLQEKTVLALVSQVEAEAHLPVHITPLLASLDHLEELGSEFVHSIACDGVILYGRSDALARFIPGQQTPAVIIVFTLKDAPPAVRMRLNRRLHGYTAWRKVNGQRKRVRYPGLITPPARSLGKGVLLVPGERRAAVIAALAEAGAVYSEIPVWVPR